MHGRSLVSTRRLVCLCADPTDPVVAHIQSWANTRNLSVTVEPVGSEPETHDTTGTLAVSVGGDGTFLEAIRVFAPRGIPVLGIDRGTLSFLPRVRPDRATAALAEVLRGEATIQPHHRFAVTGPSLTTAGINDVTLEPVQQADTHRTVTLSVAVDGESLGIYEGGGAVVSTPTGSTAMGLSADGPIQRPGGDILQFTPLHPTRLGRRTVIFDADRTLTALAHDTLTVSIDGGRTSQTLRAGDSLRITGTNRPAHVVRTSSDHSFFLALATKLGWMHGRL